MTTIVGVHGVGNHQAGHPPSTVAAHLATTWQAALTSARSPFPDHATVTAVYYAHRLRPVGAQAGGDELEQLSPTAQELVRHWLAALDLPAGTAQGRLTAGLRQDIARFAQGRGLNRRFVQRFIATCFGEVDRYLDPDSPARHLVRTDIANAIAAANRTGPTIVIAHSLGSVATYETLHAYPSLTADLLLTIGSPLAMPHGVFHRLQPTPQPRGHRPGNVRHWVNIADIGDIIAIPPYGVSDNFDGVDSDIHIEIHFADFHLAANYLKTDAIAEALRIHLQQDQR
ncbi:hypothetical protein ACFO1B_43825 [Dactylosporangium siamense]|uniref:Serine peptidase n=1 Tax=Dactylosporangium siamense TaxID=685454 RepID=A0A919UIZ8_9ACTN|nr:hypothetical protein [Dactylosporangium siamense]GIG53245.1 hypothetical protein Dsi01nite_112860 [Dactylosporangium siamense]